MHALSTSFCLPAEIGVGHSCVLAVKASISEVDMALTVILR